MHGDHDSIRLSSTELWGSTLQPMATSTHDDQLQAWVPYETTKDCSLGFCSIYCPQWCYIIFPPPPPSAALDGGGAGSIATSAFSPLVITIIGILASAFLLVSYYTILSKYCVRFNPFRRRPSDGGGSGLEDEDEPPPPHEATWHAFPSNGLDETLISKITVYKYHSGEGVVDGTDCSVCLGEFGEEEVLRLLPKCSHAFHLQCIDTWLRSHSNCPLCRANIVATEAAAPPPPPEPPAQNNELAIVIEDVDTGREEEDSNLEYECGSTASSKEPPDDVIEIGDGGPQTIRRSFSVGSWRHHGRRVSIADVLRMSMEDELLVAEDQGLCVVGAGGSLRRSGAGEHGKGSCWRSRSLHCVISPVSMKRSFSSGRFCMQGRGRNALLPI